MLGCAAGEHRLRWNAVICRRPNVIFHSGIAQVARHGAPTMYSEELLRVLAQAKRQYERILCCTVCLHAVGGGWAGLRVRFEDSRE